MMGVVLLTVFLMTNGSVTNVTYLPDLATCEKVKEVVISMAREQSWTTKGVNKPAYSECKELANE